MAGSEVRKRPSQRLTRLRFQRSLHQTSKIVRQGTGVVSQTIFPRWQDSMSALPCYLQSRIMRTKIGRHWPTFRCLSALVECLRPRISQTVSLALRHFVDRPSRENFAVSLRQMIKQNRIQQ